MSTITRERLTSIVFGAKRHPGSFTKLELELAEHMLASLEAEKGAEPVTTAYKLRDAVEIIRNSGIEIDAEKILAERDVLNSPVIPDGWVACSERVPEKADEVLCAKEFDCPGDWRQKVGYYLAGKWTVYSASWTPTHWMPLPAAPQQEVK